MLSLLLALLAPAHAAPGVVPIQGVLTDSAGAPVDGDVSVTFRLVTNDTGSIEVWTDTVTVSATDGRFAVDLGAGAALDLQLFADHPDIHLGIAVESDSEMPFVPMDHVPYAAWAEDAGKLGGQTIADLETGILAETDSRYLGTDYLPQWGSVVNKPAGFADGVDDDTTYSGADFVLSDQLCGANEAIYGVNASGQVLCQSVAVEEADLTALLNDNYLDAGYTPAWSALTGVPAGFADGVDNDTQLSQATVEAYARGVAYDTEAELTALLDDNYLSTGESLAWGDLTGVPAGLSDGDDGFTTEGQLTSLLNDNYVAASNGTASNLTTTNTLTTSLVRVAATQDVALGNSSGALVIGSATGENMGIDGNEIMARTGGGAASTLYLNREGGAVRGAARGVTGTTYSICTGQTATNAWQNYSNGAGIRVAVDISGCNFTATPFITASLHGTTGHWTTTGGSSVYNSTATGFSIYVRYANGTAPTTTTAQSSGWHIEWMAIGN